jgi:hypothetical protein
MRSRGPERKPYNSVNQPEREAEVGAISLIRLAAWIILWYCAIFLIQKEIPVLNKNISARVNARVL